MQTWFQPKLTLLAGITYVVGLVGLSFEVTCSWFIVLSPVHLLFTASLLIMGQTYRNSRFWVGLIVIAILGFFLEVLGVNSGLIFGDYWYGDGLGFKLLETPLIIGLNWAMLTIAVSSVLSRLNWPRAGVALGGGLALTLLDWIMEPVAVKLDYWYWILDEGIPLQNYLAWFAAGTTFIFILQKLKINPNNSFALPLLIYQGLFFGLLRIILGGTGS